MKKIIIRAVIVIGILVFGIIGINLSESAIGQDRTYLLDSIPSKRELRRNFFENGKLLVVYGTTDAQLAENYEKLLRKLSKLKSTRSWRNISITYKKAAELKEQDVKGKVLFLVGTVDEFPLIKEFIVKSPFALENTSIHVGEKVYGFDNALLSVGSYPSPFANKLPFGFITGENAQSVYNLLANKIALNGISFYRQNLDYEIYRGDTAVVLGNLDDEWQPDASILFNFSKGAHELTNTTHYSFLTHNYSLTDTTLNKLSNNIELTTTEILNFLDSKEVLPTMSYHIYKNTEEKGLITGNTDQAHMDTISNTVHTIVNDIYSDNYIEKEINLIIHNLLGPSKRDVLTAGLPVYFTSKWQKRGYSYWSARLFESGNSLSLVQLFNNDFLETESTLVKDCMSGELVLFLIQQWGKTSFLNKYTTNDISENEVKMLEPKWQEHLEQNGQRWPKQDRLTKNLEYLKGFNFAHEGYNIYNGYGSSKATESLKKQKDLGSNAMAIVPYSYIADVNKSAPFRFSNSAGNENDEAVVHATFTAQKMGMYTLLKPQVFVGGSWPGDIEMLTEKDWVQFFDDYYRWIRHYAFLAEIHGMDALCLGVEFTKASLSHPRKWREIIKKARGLFSGHLTYAANWGIEFEQLEFWDDLDYIGLNSYYPLSKKDNPTDEELAAKFDTIKTKIKTVYTTFKKPIVFTEIGFRSIDHPWKNPHADADETINELAQQRSYEVIFKGIQNEPWCQGILWWKYPSYLEYRGEDNNAFTPNNKLADETVRKWFSN